MANPFEIAVPDAQLHRLQQKLETASFPDELDDAEWSMGVPLAEMKRLTAYWRDGFDWRQKELELNQKLKQFMVSIAVSGFGELDIHCLHHTSPNPNAIPLLFLHGCRSFRFPFWNDTELIKTLRPCRARKFSRSN